MGEIPKTPTNDRFLRLAGVTFGRLCGFIQLWTSDGA
jgi:hypothetical protein